MGDYVMHLCSSWETPDIILTPCCTYWPIVKPNGMAPRHIAETPSGRSAWNLHKSFAHMNWQFVLASTHFKKTASWISSSKLNAKGLSILDKIRHNWYRTADLMIMFNGIKTCKVNKMEMVLQQISQLFCHQLAKTCQSICSSAMRMLWSFWKSMVSLTILLRWLATHKSHR